MADDGALNGLETLIDWIRWAASRFVEAELCFGHGTDDPIDEATALVLHALHLEPGLPDALFESRLTQDERRAVFGLIRRRIDERIPLAYLIGEARFAGLTFKVDRRVLVPRSPIAELIELGFQPWLDPSRVERVLDLCTGSGCIGIACAYAFPEAVVDISDVSEDALAVACENIEMHGLEERVRITPSDLFDDLSAEATGYDLIVSNPPYVDAEAMAALPAEFSAEPALGLVAGDDGLDLVRRILVGAPGFLRDDGLLVVEVGESRAALERTYPDLPFTWPEFAHGGEGVFVLQASALDAHSDSLEASSVGA